MVPHGVPRPDHAMPSFHGGMFIVICACPCAAGKTVQFTRNPFEKVVSGYLYHRDASEPWNAYPVHTNLPLPAIMRNGW